MANYDNNITEHLGDILTNKRGSEWVRVSRVTNNDTGVESYDARLWYLNDDDEETATAKGFRLKRPDMVDAIGKIEDSLEMDNYDVNETIEEGEDRVILAQYKAGRDEIIVARIILKDKEGVLLGDKCIDIRRWYYDDNDELKPTKKGTRLKGEVLTGVLSLIDGALRTGEVEENVTKAAGTEEAAE